MKILRPDFEAAASSPTIDPPLTHPQRLAFWQALSATCAIPQRRPARWSPEAVALRAPLLRELKVLRQHADKGTIANRYTGISITLPAGKFSVMEVYAQYCQRVHALLARIDAAMRAHGHWAAPDDAVTFKQPLEIVVANERAAGRHAGTTDWTQWESPKAVRAMTAIFDQARASTSPAGQRRRGRQWAPYLPNGDATRGAAADARLAAAWRGAFHDAIAVPLGLAKLDPHAQPLVRFLTTLQNPHWQGRIEDAIRTELHLRRSPTNRAFSTSIWRALDNQTRLELAAAYDAALRECWEALVAQGDARAEQYSPAVVLNPWALTAKELDGIAA